MSTRTTRLLAVALVIPLLAGCGIRMPADPDGTLDRVTDGLLRVGVSLSEPWTEYSGDYSGIEVALVEDFADQLNADIEWNQGGEEALVGRMERGDLDLIIGGISAETPWVEKVGVTRPYAQSSKPDGSPLDHVMLVPKGENAFLVKLERFLTDAEVPV